VEASQESVLATAEWSPTMRRHFSSAVRKITAFLVFVRILGSRIPRSLLWIRSGGNFYAHVRKPIMPQ
jgi:hypothetical protein